MSKDINFILYLRYLSSLFFGFVEGLHTPSVLKLQGVYFSSSEISIILFILSLIGCFQFITNRLDDYVTLHLPVVLLVILTIIMIYYLNINMKIFLIVHFAAESLCGLLFYNRSVRTTEILKNWYNISKFSNKQVSLLKIGGIIGYISSMVALTFLNITNNQILYFSLFLTLIFSPILILLNIKIINLLKIRVN